DTDHRAFRHVGVAGEHFLHGAGRQSVAGHVDDVIDAGHDPDIAVVIDEAGVARQVVAGVAAEVALTVTVVVPPKGRQRTGRKRPMSAPFGSSFLMARNAVGAVNKALTRCCETTRQKAPASGVPTGLPS